VTEDVQDDVPEDDDIPGLESLILSPGDLRDTLRKMNLQQKLFCEHYAETMNRKKSVLSAGYSETGWAVTANRLLNHPYCSKYAAHLATKKVQRFKYDAQDLLADTLDIFLAHKERAMGEDADPAMINALRGLLETAGKHVDLQAFRERLDVTHKTDAAEELEAALQRAETASREKRLH
jgi:phage terminase small subunit